MAIIRGVYWALVSAYNQAGLAHFVRSLSDQGIEIFATGCTADFLCQQGIALSLLSYNIEFSEQKDGQWKRQSIESVDIIRHENSLFNFVIINFPPLITATDSLGGDEAEIREQIAIREAVVCAAAKQYATLTLITDPLDYERVLTAQQSVGYVSVELRHELAYKALVYAARHNVLIDGYHQSMTHVLYNERALCLFSHKPKEEWSTGHICVCGDTQQEITCPYCQVIAQIKSTE